jgi:hypothetical protein
MIDFAEHEHAWLRLTVLQFLDADPGYDIHEYRLSDLLASYGQGVSADVLRAQITWLQEQGLVELTAVAGAYLVRARQRGIDVARGLARVPGIARPRPGA